MIARLLAGSARWSTAVLFGTLVVAVAACFAKRSLAHDAIADLSDPQIGLVAEWMGHPATEVASAVTDVLTRALDGTPGSVAVRGASMSGMAYVDVVFGVASELTAGRAEIVRRIEGLRGRLPPTVRFQIGPEASSTGWVFEYALLLNEPPKAMPMGESAREGRTKSLLAARAFQDERLRPVLGLVPGVAEVASLGGETREVRVETTPDQLAGAGVALSDLADAVRGVLRRDPHPTLQDLESAPLGAVAGGEPQALRDVAGVRVAPAMASGFADVDGAAPLVVGVVIAKRGADVTTLIANVKQALARERPHLPAGLKLGVLYDRSELAGRVDGTLLRAVAEEVGAVVLVVLLFLLHLRSAALPIVTLPLTVLLTLAALRVLDVPATVMSLGGIAIALGMAVDADVVALDACHRRVEYVRTGLDGLSRRAQIVAAAGSVTPAILTSLLIAALAFLPVFAFGGETGRLLRPLALAKTLVVIIAAVVSLTTAPALRDRLLRGRVVPEFANPLTRALVNAYRPFVHFALSRPAFTLTTAALAASSCLFVIPRLGSEFLPRIDEGDLLFMPTTSPGVSPDDAMAELARQDRAIAARPEVAMAFGKVGRADSGTDPAPFSMAETIVRLKPRSEWPTVARRRWYSGWAPALLRALLRPFWPEESAPSTAELVDALDRALFFPGWINGWTAPVRARMDMMSTGVRTPVGVRIVAADAARLDAVGVVVREAAARMPGTRSAVCESLGGETRLAFALDPAALLQHGIDAELARSTADLLLTEGYMGDVVLSAPAAHGPLPVRLSVAAPWSPKPLVDLIREATVRDRTGQETVALGLLGHPVFETERALLRSERGERVAYVYVDVAEGADLAGYVEKARCEVEASLTAAGVRLSPGERIEWTGQYALLSAGEHRLMWIAPLVGLCMLGLLVIQFRSVIEALIALLSVPFALVGSVWALYLLDYRLSAPVWVGLLSVLGLAMQTGVVMIVYIDEAFHRRVRAGTLRSRADIVAAHAEGTVRRLRPKIMTVATMAAGLLPLLWAQGAGAEIMRRVAVPMIGGLATSAFLTLEVIPVVYTIWRSHQLRTAERSGLPLERIVGRSPGWARRGA
jgi:Cu(I)/Ag(I) efflux system membrane protein CusA/SilA